MATVTEKLSIGIEISPGSLRAVAIQRGRSAALAHYRHAARSGSNSTTDFVRGLLGEFAPQGTPASVSLVTTAPPESSETLLDDDVAAASAACNELGKFIVATTNLSEPVDRTLPSELATLGASIDASATVALRAAWVAMRDTGLVQKVTGQTETADDGDQPQKAEPRIGRSVPRRKPSASAEPDTSSQTSQLTHTIARLESETGALRAELLSAITSRDQAQARAAELSTQTSSLSQQLSTVRNEMRNAGADRRQAEDEVGRLRLQLDDASVEHERRVATIKSAATETRVSAEGAISRLEAELDVVRSELDLVRADAARDQKSVLVELENVKNAAANRSVQLEAVANDLAESNRQNKQLTQQLVDARTLAEERGVEAATLATDLQVRTEELGDATADRAKLSEATKQIEQQDSALDELRRRLDAQSKEVEEAHTATAAAVVAAEKQAADAIATSEQQAADAISESAKDAEEQLDALRSEAEAELQQMRNQVVETSEQLEAARALAKARGSELEKVARSKRELAADLQNAEEVAAEGERLKGVVEQLRIAEQRLKEEAERGRTRIADLERQSADAKAKATTSASDLDDANLRLRNLDAQVEELRRLASSRADEIEELNRTDQSLRADIAKLRSASENDAVELARFRGNEQKMADEVIAAEKRADALEAQETTTRQTLADRDTEFSRLRDTHEDAKIEMDRMRAALGERADELKAIASEHAANATAIGEFQSLAEARGLELDAVRAELESTRAELDVSKAAAAKQVARARSMADEWGTEVERIAAMAEAHEEELAERSRELDSVAAARDRLTVELDKLQGATARRIERVNDEAEVRSAKLESVEAELARVRSELTIANQMAEGREEENKVLADKMTNLERESRTNDKQMTAKIEALEKRASKADDVPESAQKRIAELEAALKRLEHGADDETTARIAQLEQELVTMARESEKQVKAAYESVRKGPSGPSLPELESKYLEAHRELESSFQSAHAELQARFNGAQTQYQDELRRAHAELTALRAEIEAASAASTQSSPAPPLPRALEAGFPAEIPVMRPPPLIPPPKP